MFRVLFVFAMLGVCLTVSGQDMAVTFSGTGESYYVESVLAKNLSTNLTINVPGNETLILGQGSGILNWDPEQRNSSIFPNPFSSSCTLVFSTPNSGDAHISIRNLIGQVVYQSTEYLNPGQHFFNLSLNTEGVYIITITRGTYETSIKAICTETNDNSVGLSSLSSNSVLKASSNLNSQQATYSLAYTVGDKLAFIAKSGKHSTTITDSPTESKNYVIEFVDCTDPDQRTYPIVKIRDQMWMAENLAYLPYFTTPYVSNIPARRCYVYDHGNFNMASAKQSNNYQTYGVLYNWEAANNLCPDGWHLPSDGEWQILSDFVGSDAVHVLRTTFGWDYQGVGNNSTQFSALPGGMRNTDAGFAALGSGIFCWSSSLDGATTAKYRNLMYYSINRGSMDFPMYSRSTSRNDAFSIRCLQNKPSIQTYGISHITDNSARVGVNLLYFDSPEDIEMAGVCWSSQENPMIVNSRTEELVGLGEFFTEITNLIANREYYVRAYFTTSSGSTYYGNQETLRTVDGGFTDARDSTQYGYVTIGTQTWMAENLAYLPSIGGRYSVYRDNGETVEEAKQSSFFRKYGVLYDYRVVQTACPEGWKLPSDDDWKDLELYLGMSTTEINKENVRYSGQISNKLKSTFGWYNSANGSNSSGFNALPGGAKLSHGGTEGAGDFGIFWNSTNSTDQGYRCLTRGGGIIRRFYDYRGASIRCIKQ